MLHTPINYYVHDLEDWDVVGNITDTPRINEVKRMKVRIVQAGICLYEVEVKRAWYLPWATVYDGCLPWRGSFANAKKIKAKILEDYG